MASSLDEDVRNLKLWISGAWRCLADPRLTAFDRREMRNTMIDAERALAVALRGITKRERARRDTERASIGKKRLYFRIIQLQA